MVSSSSHRTSLLTATDCRSHVHLIIGSNSLAGKRCEQSLATGAKPILVTPDPDAPPPSSSSSSSPATTQPLHYGLTKLIESGHIEWRRQVFAEDLLFTLGREEIGRVVDAVFITSNSSAATAALSSISSSAGATAVTAPTAQTISALCKRNRIPVNVVDRPDLCSFSILSTHTDGPLQIGITTNGRGCHLASRIRREVAAALPSELGTACARLGNLRRRIQEEDHLLLHEALSGSGAVGGPDAEGLEEQAASFNQLVTEEDLDAAKNRRMRWLAQVCEYWPLKRLAAISDEDVETVLKSYHPGLGGNSNSNSATTRRGPKGGDDGVETSSPPNGTGTSTGRIILAGSGPGHPDLLTRATHKAIQTADLILADKLVPAGVLDLIPRRTPVSIARKFPGNADRAQEELLAQALAGVRAGQTVLRLKQGDPFLYGRGGEEVAFFREQGLGDRVLVLPGITSALSAPLFAGVPPTQRDVADQVLICTGTGKKGKAPAPPEYVASRTCVFLMALHRIGGLVAELTEYTAQELSPVVAAEEQTPVSAPTTSESGIEQLQQEHISPPATSTSNCNCSSSNNHQPPKPTRALWPKSTPCTVIERASCPDQRVIRTTLASVAEAIEHEGSRPPGLLVVGRACEALYTPPPPSSGSVVPWTVEEGGFKGWFLDDGVTDGASASSTTAAAAAMAVLNGGGGGGSA